MALLLLPATPLLARADSALGSGGKAAASIDLRVVIPTVLRIEPVSQPSHLQLDGEHIRQGYVDLDEATVVRMVSNARRGIDLSVALDGTLVSRAVIRVLGNEWTADAAGATTHVATPRLNGEVVKVSYRLYLDRRATAGTHRWPVGLRFSPASA